MFGQRFAFNQLHHERASRAAGPRRRLYILESIYRGDVGVIERRQQLCFARNRERRSASPKKVGGKTLMATSRFSFVSRAR